LEKDSQRVESAATAALSKCGIVANLSCARGTYSNFSSSQTSNTTIEQAEITASFQRSLGVVSKVANDKYFGVDDLKPTADSLNEIIDDLKELNGTMVCSKSTPLFCSIYNSAGSIVAGMSSVNKAINAFENSEPVQRWEDYQDFVILLHGLPYIMVVALLFFTCFWMKGGVCCCCKGGTICGVAVIPFALFWLISMSIYTLICFIGLILKYAADKIEVPMLKGKPNLEQAINHIETAFPEFWKLVFASMEHGLNLLLNASVFFVVAGIIAAFYSLAECCCCPYRKSAQEKEKARSSY